MEHQATELLVATASDATPVVDLPIYDMLRLIRQDLDMDVVFVAEFIDGQRVFRQVEQRPGEPIVEEGQMHSQEDSLCQRVIEGRLPRVMHDVASLVEAHGLPSYASGLGAHISAPVRLRDGHVYGTLCCFSLTPNYALGERDVRRLEMAAHIVGRLIDEARGHEAPLPE